MTRRGLIQALVVDDEALSRQYIVELVTQDPRFQVVAACASGCDAVATAATTRPDVAFLDVRMPRMDGFEVATLVRHDEFLKDLPIIMITSRTGSKHRERAMAIGVNEYLGKPYQESLLLETIQQLVKKHD